jgi:hypothetical protein
MFDDRAAEASRRGVLSDLADCAQVEHWDMQADTTWNGDPAVGARYDAAVALWSGSSEPSVAECLELTSTQAITGPTRVRTGTIVCTHTNSDRVVIAKIAKATASGSRTPALTLTATVWGPE